MKPESTSKMLLLKNSKKEKEHIRGVVFIPHGRLLYKEVDLSSVFQNEIIEKYEILLDDSDPYGGECPSVFTLPRLEKAFDALRVIYQDVYFLLLIDPQHDKEKEWADTVLRRIANAGFTHHCVIHLSPQFRYEVMPVFSSAGIQWK
jgi:hypothetical protein